MLGSAARIVSETEGGESMTQEFYTPYGWKGKKFAETEKLSLKEIAQRIKQEILGKHPEITVSVSTEHFSNGCAVNIRVKSVPFKAFVKEPLYPGQQDSKYFTLHYTDKAKELIDDIRHIANQYRRDDSDAQIDYFNTNFYCTPDFDYELRRKEEIELGIL
jgi:hypothetical protein